MNSASGSGEALITRRFKVISSTDGDRWDQFVAAAPNSTFCHLAGWREIMTDVLRHECQYLVVEDDGGTWRGVLPLVRVRGLLGHYMVSMPFLNDGGPLGDDEACRLLAEHAVSEAEQSGASLLELRSRNDIPGPVRATHRKITVVLPLPETVDDLWARTFKAKLRSQIRRPGKEGMTARAGLDQLAPFYDVFAQNMRDLGTPVLPRAFFERIAALFGDRAVFAAVYTPGGDAVAGACSWIWRDELEVTWASSLRAHNKSSPNMLLYAHLMEEAVKLGVRVFNFGRCTADGPTHRFKQQWGGHDVPLSWPSWSRNGTIGTPSPDRPAFRLATAAWSRLPLAIANRLGPVLARQIP